jgi:hypothetical protein
MGNGTNDSCLPDGSDLSRRTLLAATGGGLLAGCLGGSESTPTPTDVGTPSPTPPPTPTDEADDGPLTGTEGGETDVHVADYGAEPGVDEDQTAAIRDAFRAAAKQGATITFEEGTYHCNSSGPVTRQAAGGTVPLDQTFFTIEEFEDLTIEGNGATISLAGRVVDGTRHFAQTFKISNCPGLTIRDVTIDWDRDIPHTGGTVVENTDEYADIEVADGYTPREGLMAVALHPYDLERDHLVGSLHNQNGSGARCERRSDSILRVEKTDAHANTLQEGQGVQVRHMTHEAMGMRMNNNDDLLLQNVVFHSIPGFACTPNGHNVTVEDCAVTPRDDLFMSACRDGFHLGSTSGKLRFRNVTATKSGDDAFNLKVTRREATVKSPNTLELNNNVGSSWFDVGDEIEVGTGPNPYVPEATMTIADMEGPTAHLDLIFENDLPESVQNADLISAANVSKMPDTAVIENSKIGALRGTCRFMIDNLTLRNVEFEHMGTPWIFMVGHLEGVPPSNLTMEECTFKDCGGIFPLITHYPTESLTADFMTGHTFRNNTWENQRDTQNALRLDFMSELTFEGNDFSGLADGVQPVNFGNKVDCDTVTIDGQTGCTFPPQ